MPKFSSWREGSAARRDTRQAPAPLTANTRSVPNKRDTKRWCKGKVGVEHKLVVKTRRELGKEHYRSPDKMPSLCRYCEACGREFDWYHPWFKADRQNPPQWVVEYRAQSQKKAS